MMLDRRKFLGAFSASVALAPVLARGQTLSVRPAASGGSAAFQTAVNQAAAAGGDLYVEAGTYHVSGIDLPSNLTLRAARGTVTFIGAGEPVFMANGSRNLTLEGLAFDGAAGGASDGSLVSLQNCEALLVENCSFHSVAGNGLTAYACSGSVRNCRFETIGQTALHLQDSAGMAALNNVISDCGNGGIRVWRYEGGQDGTIVSGNRISAIRSQSGNGQNGNGINVFQADGVICADNVISDCDFSALRANTTNDTIFTGNQCLDCREVAIFSEFGFSGSIIADNLIDRAASGISITNLDSGGHLAVCSGNIVRNISRNSPTNPDTVPTGIFAEADTAVTGNVVENVPGTGIGAGWGPYLRNVLVADNVISDTLIGIGVSVVDGAGAVRIVNNLISGSSAAAIAGLRWREIATADLSADAGQFTNVEVGGNTIS